MYLLPQEQAFFWVTHNSSHITRKTRFLKKNMVFHKPYIAWKPQPRNATAEKHIIFMQSSKSTSFFSDQAGFGPHIVSTNQVPL